jgi:serine/threonine-protein kinase ULK/ATG1
MSSKTRRSSIKEEYEDVEEIGVGSFATVYRARHRPTGRIVAIKAVHLKRLSNAKLWANLQAECEALRQVGSQQHIGIIVIAPKRSHAHEPLACIVVELYDIVRGDKYVYLVMEYCDRGDLQSYARDYGKRTKQPRGRLPEPNVRRLMAQLKEAVRALHSCNLVHRDLKPQNLLLKSASPMSSSSSLLDQNLVLKVADFGFVRRMDTSQEQAETMCGSPLYMVLGQSLIACCPRHLRSCATKSTTKRPTSGASEQSCTSCCMDSPHIGPRITSSWPA